MGSKHEQIMVLAEMIEAFDKNPPCRGRETTAFIERWRKKELSKPHNSPAHIAVAVSGINRHEIQNIRETKKFRDEQRERKQTLLTRAPSCATNRL